MSSFVLCSFRTGSDDGRQDSPVRVLLLDKREVKQRVRLQTRLTNPFRVFFVCFFFSTIKSTVSPYLYLNGCRLVRFIYKKDVQPLRTALLSGRRCCRSWKRTASFNSRTESFNSRSTPSRSVTSFKSRTQSLGNTPFGH